MISPTNSEARLSYLIVVWSDAQESSLWEWPVLQFPVREQIMNHYALLRPVHMEH